jgi:hypothetical protein
VNAQKEKEKEFQEQIAKEEERRRIVERLNS